MLQYLCVWSSANSFKEIMLKSGDFLFLRRGQELDVALLPRTNCNCVVAEKYSFNWHNCDLTSRSAWFSFPMWGGTRREIIAFWQLSKLIIYSLLWYRFKTPKETGRWFFLCSNDHTFCCVRVDNSCSLLSEVASVKELSCLPLSVCAHLGKIAPPPSLWKLCQHTLPVNSLKNNPRDFCCRDFASRLAFKRLAVKVFAVLTCCQDLYWHLPPIPCRLRSNKSCCPSVCFSEWNICSLDNSQISNISAKRGARLQYGNVPLCALCLARQTAFGLLSKNKKKVGE